MTGTTRASRSTLARACVVALAVSAALIGAPTEALAQGDRYAVLVLGATGGEPYSSAYRKWLDSAVTSLKGPLGFDPARLTVLAEQPKPGEQAATAENVRSSFAALSARAKDGDFVFVMLIGHGGGDGADAKFNLVGPDLTVVEWSALVSPVKARLAFVDTTGGSFPFLKGLSAPGRVVVTATNSYAQKYAAVFADGFIQAWTANVADADKNGRISLLEAFAYGSLLVKQHYEQKGTMATEHAVFNDTGDGAAHDMAVAGAAPGTVAGLTYLDQPRAATSSNPELQRLLSQQQALTQQVDDLRRRRPTMPAEAYDQEFEKLIVELALVSREVRRRSGG